MSADSMAGKPIVTNAQRKAASRAVVTLAAAAETLRMYGYPRLAVQVDETADAIHAAARP